MTALQCSDCAADITLEQYRRKVARCDDCEVEAFAEVLETFPDAPEVKRLYGNADAA